MVATPRKILGPCHGPPLPRRQHLRVFDKIREFRRDPYIEKVATISEWLWLIRSQLYYARFFRQFGSRSKILRPLRLKNVQNISIGQAVMIHNYCWLQTLPIFHQTPELVIGDHSVIGNFNHITCARKVLLGEKVLTADRVFISDNAHDYENPDKPIIEQPVISRGTVSIGSGTWLGENVVVLSCNIGKNCIIGANSVVTRDIPDLSVAAGVPAKVIKRFNQQSRSWERVLSTVSEAPGTTP